MTDTLEHHGVKGMKWKETKNVVPPDSLDSRRAHRIQNRMIRHPDKVPMELQLRLKRRDRLEERLRNASAATGLFQKRNANVSKLSNEQILTLLRSPIMRTKMADFIAQKRERAKKIVDGIFNSRKGGLKT